VAVEVVGIVQLRLVAEVLVAVRVLTRLQKVLHLLLGKVTMVGLVVVELLLMLAAVAVVLVQSVATDLEARVDLVVMVQPHLLADLP
jgi:hypothetical protein